MVAFAALGADSSMASGPNPYPGAFASSRDGRWYTIVSREGSFWLVKRHPDRTPREENVQTIPAGVDPRALPVLRPDGGDVVVAQGRCGRPEEVRTLDGGRGFLAFEEWALGSRGRILALYGGRGVERWSRKLEDLFPAEAIRRFERGMVHTFWKRRWWLSLDETYAVLVAVPARATVLDLSNGQAQPLHERVLVDRLAADDTEGVSSIVEAALAEGAEWLPARAREELVRGRALDRVALRLYASLASSGGLSDADRKMFRSILQSTGDVEARKYGLRVAGVVDPAHASEILLSAVRAADPELVTSIASAAEELSETMLPALRGMATDATAAKRFRVSAVHVLAVLAVRRPEIVSVLVALTLDPVPRIAASAVGALIAMEGREVSDALARVLVTGTAGEEDALAYFVAKPEERAVPGLIAALKRREGNDDPWKQSIVDALRTATGQDLGPRSAAWEEWLRKRGK